ncbi:hypothetical protein GBF38_022151 [Nibea albiflora]|uniref:Uncharacterized protein n=1 Tax=Nibea albiflora TaxID=240163 RepID=A0ACB7FKN3_NIBAL|nr:hypothetical protein GBF38_022151 [Nibea albiflora]
MGRETVADVPPDGFLSTHPAISFLTSNPGPDSRANCITRGADLVIDNEEEQVDFCLLNFTIKTFKFFYFFHKQKFVGDTIENMKVSSSNEWKNAFWVGLRDTEIEGTWVWINNVTEVEQRLELLCNTLNAILININATLNIRTQ